MGDFVNEFPDRYFEFGIAEQNMLTASAAIASEVENLYFP
jgi:transketolase